MFIENRRGQLINISFMDKISVHNNAIYATSDYNCTMYTLDVFDTKEEAEEALEVLKEKMRKQQLIISMQGSE